MTKKYIKSDDESFFNWINSKINIFNRNRVRSDINTNISIDDETEDEDDYIDKDKDKNLKSTDIKFKNLILFDESLD